MADGTEEQLANFQAAGVPVEVFRYKDTGFTARRLAPQLAGLACLAAGQALLHAKL